MKLPDRVKLNKDGKVWTKIFGWGNTGIYRDHYGNRQAIKFEDFYETVL